MFSVRPAFAIVVTLALIYGTASPSKSASFFGLKMKTMDFRHATDAPPIDEASLVRYSRKGYGSIKGHLGIADVTEAGNQITFDANDVYLVPAIPYTQWYFMTYLTKNFKRFDGRVYSPNRDQRVEFDPLDPTVLKYSRKFKTDAEGRYEFSNLPTGNYYVIAFVEHVINGTVTRGNDFVGYNTSSYKASYLSLLGDDPPLEVSGDRPGSASNLIRIVPNERWDVACASDGKLAPCVEVVDLDQFLGGRGDY
jgi:hypothetical protein